MVKLALLVTFEARPGKEQEVEQFLKSGLGLVDREPNTINWYALKIGNGTYGIFDTFEDENGRKAHLSGEVAKALTQRGGELFSKTPKIETVELIAVKEEMAHQHH